MAKLNDILPQVTGQEMYYLQNLIKDWDDEKARKFALIYQARRKDPTLILVLTILGFFGIAGIQRIITNQIGMGLLYLFTWGLCGIGSIIDLVNYQSITMEYNIKVAAEVAASMDN